MSDTAVLETLTYFIFTECRGKDTVLQPRRQQWASERETVTLDCEYNTTSSNPTLLWYQQKDQHSPKYILLTNSYGAGDTAAEFKERFHSNLSTRTAPLMIQKLSVMSDSALYYCALQPTVTGNSTTLYKNTQSKRPICVKFTVKSCGQLWTSDCASD
uniref:Ig-like domain-containing protein n=1 Tax=Pygocentrus nattereri TaxID=42514 RepID=A0A3B4CIB9_PYGNA